MTTPIRPEYGSVPAGPIRPAPYHDYERELGIGSPVDQQEWALFLKRRQKLLNDILGSVGVAGNALGMQSPPSIDTVIGGSSTTAPGAAPAPTTPRPPSQKQLERASFWKIQGAENMDEQVLEQEIERRRAGETRPVATTAKSALLGLLAGSAQAGSSLSEMMGNLYGNIESLPFIGKLLKDNIYIERKRAFWQGLEAKTAGIVEAARAQQPTYDLGAFDFLTGAGKMAGYTLPAVAAWEGLGLAAGFPALSWAARAGTPLLRLATKGALSAAMLESPEATGQERVMNLGLGAILGGASMWGRAGAAIGAGVVGAGVGGSIGATPEERRRNALRWGVGAASLPLLAPVLASAFLKVTRDIPTWGASAIPVDQTGRAAPGEEMADFQIIRDLPQQSGNPPRLAAGAPGAGAGTEPTTPEQLASLIRAEPTRQLGPTGVPMLPASTTEPAGATQHYDAAAFARMLGEMQGGDLANYPTELVAGMQRAGDRAVFEGQRYGGGAVPEAVVPQEPAGPGALGRPQVRGLLPATTEPSSGLESLKIDENYYRTIIGSSEQFPPEYVAQARTGLELVRRMMDAEVYQAQRFAPLSAKGLAEVTQGPKHLRGSKVAASDGSPLRVYHGTGIVFDEFDPAKLDAEALFGPGLYHTESAEIAAGYAGANTGLTWLPGGLETAIERVRTVPGVPLNTSIDASNVESWAYDLNVDISDLGIHKNSNVRPAYLDIKNPFDIDRQYTPQEIGELIDRLATQFPEYDLEPVRSLATGFSYDPTGTGSTVSGEAIYNELADVSSGTQRQGPVQLVGGNAIPVGGGSLGKAGLNYALESIGFDGITHIGGARTGNNPHRVWIAFRPEQVHPTYAPRPMPVEEAVAAAEAITKQATVMESEALPEIIGKPQVTDADVVTAAKASNPGGVAIIRNIGKPMDVLLEHPDVRFIERQVQVPAPPAETLTASAVRIRATGELATGPFSEGHLEIGNRVFANRPGWQSITMGQVEDGFITSTGRFVNRNEAMDIARAQAVVKPTVAARTKIKFLIGEDITEPQLQLPTVQLDALVGKFTDEMVEDYKRWGTYEGNVVTTASGIEGEVIAISSKGIATLKRTSGGPPLRVKAENLLPSRWGDPVYEGPDLWNSFKADLLRSLNEEAGGAGMAPIEDIWDTRALSEMQSHLEDFLDRRGINDPAARHAIDRIINQRFVEEARDLDPEARDLQARLGDEFAAAANEDELADLPIPVSLEEKAASRGFIWITAEGRDGGHFRDMLNPEGGLEVPVETDAAAEEFLRTVDRTLPDLTPASDVPLEVMEFAPTDTGLEPRLGVEEHADMLADHIEEFDDAWSAEMAADEAMADRVAAELEAFNERAGEAPSWRPPGFETPPFGGGAVPPTALPPSGFEGSWEPWPRGRIEGEGETLGGQFKHLERADPQRWNELKEKFSHNLFRYTRYLMGKVERELYKSGVTLGRAWKHFEELETARIVADSHAHPWIKEWSEIMREYPRRVLREGHATRIHEIEDPNARMAAFWRLKGYSDVRIKRMIAADARITDFMHRWFEFLTEDPAFALTADRELFRYMPHVRAMQAKGAPDPFNSSGYLSPNVQFFAEFAREGNMQFRIMDARELGSIMVRAGMFKKYQAGPWEQLVSAWQDPRVPKEFQDLLIGHANLMRYGYDAKGDIAVRAIQGLMKYVFRTPITRNGAMRLMGVPINGMYMAKLAGRPAIFFRDAIQPLLALAKVRMPFMAGVYKDVLGGAIADRDLLRTMFRRGLEGGWIIQDQPAIEGLGAFEAGGRDVRELAGISRGAAQRRELAARIGDVAAELPAWLARPTESRVNTLHWYGKEQQLNRLIVGESAWRQATQALGEFRRSEMEAALARDPDRAMKYQDFADKAFFSSFEDQIALRLKELVDAGRDGEAANLFAREVANWSQFKYGRRENPQALRGNFGRFMTMFGSFTGQFTEAAVSAAGNGTFAHRARAAMVIGGMSYALGLLAKKIGWSFGKWAWTGALKYVGGPGMEMLAKGIGAAGGAMALSDDRKPSPFQKAAMEDIGRGSAIGLASQFFPYTGYVQTAAEIGSALQGTNPLEQIARYTITGDRGSRIDIKRQGQQNAIEMLMKMRQNAEQRKDQLPPAFTPRVPSGPTSPYHVPPRGSRHPGSGAQQ